MNNLQLALLHADKIEQMLIDSGGEITPEIEMEMSIDSKTIGELIDVRYVSIERLEKAQEFFKAKAESFLKVAQALDSAVDYSKDAIKQYMIETGKKELKGTDYQFKLANSAPKVKITNEEFLDASYKKETVTVSIDKKKIVEDLKSGIMVEGCVLEEVYSLRKSINKGAK